MLAVDIGDKRTGLAVGDDVTGVVTPVQTLNLPLGDALLDALCGAVTEHEPDVLVVGLPLNMDGTEGPRARLVRDLAERLAGRVETPVHYQDERLTSFAADQKMARSGRTHGQKKALRDALAAAEILRDYLTARGPTRPAEES